jgi:hypothetical protein
MCDRPHDKAVRSPWTEGAWIMRHRDIPVGWSWRGDDKTAWHVEAADSTGDCGCVVEAKP